VVRLTSPSRRGMAERFPGGRARRVVAGCVETVGDAAQKRAFGFTARRGVGGKGLCRKLDGVIHFGDETEE